MPVTQAQIDQIDLKRDSGLEPIIRAGSRRAADLKHRAMRFESHFSRSLGEFYPACRELNLKKLKYGLSPSPQWLAGGGVAANVRTAKGLCQKCQRTKELTQDLWPSIAFQKTPESCTLGPLKRHNAFWSEF